MAGSAEYRNEKFISHYEHIKKLDLLTDEELLTLKRKRSFFEVSVQNATEIKQFIDYIKYEIALMRKFKQMEYEDEDNGRALEIALSQHVRDLFRLALKKFQDKRKVWEHYILFCKQKSPNIVTRIYEEMLHFHHKTEDYIEAAEHEMSRNNFEQASNILIQGIGSNKESSDKLVAVYIECSLKQGEDQDESEKEATLLQVSKFYSKFLQKSSNVELQCQLLRKIQSFDYALSFQNDVLKNLMQFSSGRAEVWNLLALRHLDGIYFEDGEAKEQPARTSSYHERLQQMIKIYEKSLEFVCDEEKTKIYTFYIEKLLELDSEKKINSQSLKIIRRALGKAFSRGLKEEKLSDVHFVYFLKLRMLEMVKNREVIEEMLTIGKTLYPNSMEFFELAFRFHLREENHEKIAETFKLAVKSNEKMAIELYRFLCAIYLSNSDGEDKARSAMLEAVNSANKKLSEAFQPYYIEYHALTDGIEKARELYNNLLTTKTMKTLSLEFFKIMIKMEEIQENPDEKLIRNCYERASEHFGKESSEIWLDYIRHMWKTGKHTEADELRKRAMSNLKDDLNKIQEFEMKFTLLRNQSGSMDFD